MSSRIPPSLDDADGQLPLQVDDSADAGRGLYGASPAMLAKLPARPTKADILATVELIAAEEADLNPTPGDPA